MVAWHGPEMMQGETTFLELAATRHTPENPREVRARQL